MTSEALSLSNPADPSRRRFLAFGSVAALGGAMFANSRAAFGAVRPAPARLLNGKSADLSQLISAHRNSMFALDSAIIDLCQVEEAAPAGTFDQPKINLLLFLEIENKEKHWPWWVDSHKAIDETFDKFLQHDSRLWTDEARERAHSAYAESLRQIEATKEQLGIPEKGATKERRYEEADQALEDLTGCARASFADCRATAEYLIAYMKEYESITPSDPLHRFVLALAGATISDEVEVAQ